MYKRLSTLFLAFTLAIAMADAAQALAIRNLSGAPQVLMVSQGEAAQTLHLADRQTIYLTGGTYWIATEGRKPIQARFDEEYILWPSGKLIIQKRMKMKGSR